MWRNKKEEKISRPGTMAFLPLRAPICRQRGGENAAKYSTFVCMFV